MSGLGAIFRRELSGLFFQPLAWALLFLALLLNGFLFTYYLRLADGDVSSAMLLSLGQSWLFWGLLCVLCPLITMRMVSEETRSGVLEFLRTAPVTDAAVVTGKLLAATVFFAVLWGAVPVYGVVVDSLGVTPDWGQLMTAYAGAVLLSALFCALGLLASTLTSTPALAAFLAFLLNVGLWLGGYDTRLSNPLELFIYATCAFVVVVLAEAWMLPGALAFLAAFFLSMAYEGTSLFWMNLANLAVVMNGALVWGIRAAQGGPMDLPLLRR